MQNAELKDEYCLEKIIADSLSCKLPGTVIEGEQYKECKLNISDFTTLNILYIIYYYQLIIQSNNSSAIKNPWHHLKGTLANLISLSIQTNY